MNHSGGLQNLQWRLLCSFLLDFFYRKKMSRKKNCLAPTSFMALICILFHPVLSFFRGKYVTLQLWALFQGTAGNLCRPNSVEGALELSFRQFIPSCCYRYPNTVHFVSALARGIKNELFRVLMYPGAWFKLLDLGLEYRTCFLLLYYITRKSYSFNKAQK